MPGKWCYGENRNSAGKELADSKAFCEAIAYRASGTAAQRPKSANPHYPGSERHRAWDNGWDLAQINAGGQISKKDAGCCAVHGLTIPL